ncbi:LuxR C-terminal-related transcriptional regulator [Paenibacillus endoradicis]|uniref:LuxR C-terminal-related transcriptional regulator n=1 Tax=Paenibacillus endoradicis TaxID=2972487 RepID=UPI002158B6F6|nr:LuxR C-terminal-related transcriptional regulator [Paenibacillus endoradicis]MCR8659681.1 LuxR C-terminal-related transcriptional regulator [Paenibacillus endoradicis]
MPIHTKFHIPQVRQSAILRPELMKKLDLGKQCKLTLVSAQAGYGKTTALSEWVKRSNKIVAWISLDSQNNEWIQFWTYILASIRGKTDEFSKDYSIILETSSSNNMEPLLAFLLNELNRLSHDLYIILDDYHVITLPTIQQSINHLIEHLPSHIHLYIATRADNIPKARLLAKGELNRISMDDLRFKFEESYALFQAESDLFLSDDQIVTLLDKTEGWISGLQLAVISLKQSKDVMKTIEQINGQQRQIADYLLEEVFQHLPDSVKDFLLETAILTQMNYSLCEKVTGRVDCQEQIEALERLNLFIIAMDEQRNWYRYHHLLSEFLQQQLRRRDLVKWRKVHKNAAEWYEQHGFDDIAVEHYLEAEEHLEVVRLIEKNLDSLVQFKSVFLIRWVTALPENCFSNKPLTELFYISVLLGVGEWHTAFLRIQQAEKSFEALQGSISDAAWNQAMGNVYFFCAISTYLQKDLEKTSAYFELVEQYMSEGSVFLTMGRNRYQGFADFDDHLSLINNLKEAENFLEKWIARWGSKRNFPFVGYLYASYSKLLYEWNRLDEAESIVNEGLNRSDIQPFARILSPLVFSAARIQLAKGNNKEASALLAGLPKQINSPDYERFMPSIRAEVVHHSIQEESYEPVREWLDNCGILVTDDASLFHMPNQLIFAKALLVCGDHEEIKAVLELLGRMNDLLEQQGRLRDRIKVVILQSIAHYRLKAVDLSLDRLNHALFLAGPEGYIRSFIDETIWMRNFIRLFIKRQNSKLVHDKYDASLIYSNMIFEAMQLNSDEENDLNLTDKEIEVLLLIAEGLSNKEIASRLLVTGETVKFHIKNVYRKLEVNNRIHAIQQAKIYMIID